LRLSRRLFREELLTGGSRLRVRVRFFALYEELTGRDEEEYVLKSGSKVEDLIDLVVEKHESMKGVTGMLVAINNAFVKYDASLRDGEEVALFPPVSGG
jgi:molybdopterin converting factor subunit 1